MNHYTFYLYLIHHAKFSDQLKLNNSQTISILNTLEIFDFVNFSIYRFGKVW